MTEWLDRLAADLVHVESEVRAALLAVARRRPHPRLHGPFGQFLISQHEARTLLRAAMPAPIAATRQRDPHARMLLALQLFGQHLLTLNNAPPHRSIRTPAVGAAVVLLDELREWVRVAQWREATRRARVAWPVPVPVTGIIGPATRTNPERLFDATHLPSAAAGGLHHPAAAMRYVDQLRADQLTLPLPDPAAVVDLRQLPLQLHARAA